MSDVDLPRSPGPGHMHPCPGECGGYLSDPRFKCINCWTKWNPRSRRVDRVHRGQRRRY